MEPYTIKRSLLGVTAAPRRAWQSLILPATPDALFIWIPKSAGTSVFTSLAQLGMRKFKSLDKTRHLFTGSGLVTFVHQSVAALVAQGALDAGFVARALKFGFVRNPYQRAASLHRYYQKMDRIPRDLGFAAFLTLLEREWAEHAAMAPPAPAAMSARLKYYGEEFHVGNHRLYPVGLYNSLEWSQCRPQLDWFDGLGPLDEMMIGRVESIDRDFRALLAKLGELSGRPLPELAVGKLNTTVPSGQSGRSGPYEDAALRRIVETIYARDFEAFGY